MFTIYFDLSKLIEINISLCHLLFYSMNILNKIHKKFIK